MKDILTKNWGTARISFLDRESIEIRPTEIHLKEDGSRENGSSLAIVLSVPNQPQLPIIVGQISIKILNEALGELGYQITTKTK